MTAGASSHLPAPGQRELVMPGRALLRPCPPQAQRRQEIPTAKARGLRGSGGLAGQQVALLPLLFPAYLGETPEDKPMRTPRPQGQFSGRRRDECEGVAKTRTKTPSPHIHRALRPPLTRTDNISPERQPALSPLPGAPCPWPRVQSRAAAHSPSRQHQTWPAVLGRQPSPLQAPGRWEGPVGGVSPVGGAGRI